MSDEKLKILVAGHITHDDYNGELLPGGSAYYCSRAYLELGAEVILATSVGRDFRFKEVFEGIKTFSSIADKTTQFFNSYPSGGGVRIQTCNARAENISPSLLPPEYITVDVLHLAPVIGETDLIEWLSNVKAKTVVLGLQGFLRLIDDQHLVKPNNWHPDIPEPFKIDTVFLSEEDLIGHNSLFNDLLSKANMVVLTSGKSGSHIYCENNVIKTGIFNTTEVDPTGAGDIYSAAFTYSLAAGDSIVTSAKHGAAFASVIIEGKGGIPLSRLKEGWNRWESIPASVLK